MFRRVSVFKIEFLVITFTFIFIFLTLNVRLLSIRYVLSFLLFIVSSIRHMFPLLDSRWLCSSSSIPQAYGKPASSRHVYFSVIFQRLRLHAIGLRIHTCRILVVDQLLAIRSSANIRICVHKTFYYKDGEPIVCSS